MFPGAQGSARSLAACVAFSCACAAMPVRAADAQLTFVQRQSLDTAGSNALAQYAAPGIALAIERAGTIVYRHGFGLRDVARGRPVDSNTVFALGPVTKQFTAAAIELLVLANKISLDAKVSAYLPNAPHASEIRVGELLHETSGLPDYLAPETLAAVTTSKTITPQAILDTVAGKPLDFPPGSRCEHNGTNYVALGAIVEAVTGKSYGDFIRDAIAKPLKLSSLAFGPPSPGPDSTEVNLSYGYDLVEFGRKVTAWTPEATSAAGGLYASAADVAKWDAALYGGKFFPEDAVAALTAPVTLSDRSASDCAAGATVETFEGNSDVLQRGGIPGASVLNSWSPQTDTAIVIFGNSIAFDPGELQRAAVAALTPAAVTTAREDPRATARARSEYRAWQTGTVDPARYGDEMQKLIASPAALDIFATLKAAGDPVSFIFEGSEHIRGGTLHRYLAETAHGTFAMSIAYGDDGTIVKVAFERTK